jgi:CxxC motif-containing protein
MTKKTDKVSEIICVTCPQGCLLKVKHDGDQVLDVLESGCQRGREYAICELQDPRRMVASTVRVIGGLHPLVPVYTRSAFPKPMIPQLAQALRQIELTAPVEINQVILADALGTGIDIVASRDMPEEQL